MGRRHELTEAKWARLAPLLPRQQAGKPRKDDRLVHCAPDAQRSELLDASSTSQEPLSRFYCMAMSFFRWGISRRFRPSKTSLGVRSFSRQAE